MLVIGNDIVDLADHGNKGKFRDRRFRDRVFTTEEGRRIDAAPDPDAMLWTLWAAKEAAFKAAVKLRPGLGFIPRSYRVLTLRGNASTGGSSKAANSGNPWEVLLSDDGIEVRNRDDRRYQYPLFHNKGEGNTEPGWNTPPLLSQESAEGAAASAEQYGSIDTPAGCLDLVSWISSKRAHCLAAGSRGHNGRGASPSPSIQVREEERTASFDPSAAVRRAAIHHLAGTLRTSPYYLDIRRVGTSRDPHGPPRVFLYGRQTDIDISLSHDGAYIAFAVNINQPCS